MQIQDREVLTNTTFCIYSTLNSAETCTGYIKGTLPYATHRRQADSMLSSLIYTTLQ